MRAVERILDERGTNLPQNSKNCILEALSITMSSYNGHFLGELFTQIDGATIGGPESASVTDIFGAVYVDEMARQGNEHLRPIDRRRFRDDTWDIEEDCDDISAKRFTDHLNENILRDKIKFELVSRVFRCKSAP